MKNSTGRTFSGFAVITLLGCSAASELRPGAYHKAGDVVVSPGLICRRH